MNLRLAVGISPGGDYESFTKEIQPDGDHAQRIKTALMPP
jgi:hypothetical protein